MLKIIQLLMISAFLLFMGGLYWLCQYFGPGFITGFLLGFLLFELGYWAQNDKFYWFAQ